MPMLGTWWHFTLVIAAVLFTSLGICFVISIVSQTDSQAMQYSMIILLASVFSAVSS
jgi:membrane glycosyltransferase